MFVIHKYGMVSYHPSGALKFKVALRFLETLYTPDIKR